MTLKRHSKRRWKFTVTSTLAARYVLWDVTQIIICITQIVEIIVVILRLSVTVKVLLVDVGNKDFLINDRLCVRVFVRRHGVINYLCTAQTQRAVQSSIAVGSVPTDVTAQIR